jgi:hypothetical protein
MSDIETVYEDEWGSIIDRPNPGFLEIRWFDTTSMMTRAQFNRWLETFADHVEERRRPSVLVDATCFRMKPEEFDPAWRDTHIIPRYNRAGLQKFAFHMPEGMPLIGRPAEKEGPGQFPTGYFGTRADAISWLKNP